MDTIPYKSKSVLPLKSRYSIDYLFQQSKGNARKAQDLVQKKICKLVKSINLVLDIPITKSQSNHVKSSFEISKSIVLSCKRILYELKTKQIGSKTATPGNIKTVQQVECVGSNPTQESVPQMTRSHKGSQQSGCDRIKCEVIRHIMDHQGVTEYYSGRARNEIQDQISMETATLDRKLEYSKVMEELSKWKTPWLSFPITLTQQQRARNQVLFGMATADEQISKVYKETQLRDYLLDHIHNQAVKKVKESSLQQDYTKQNQREDPEYSKFLQDRLIAIKNAKIDILRAVDKGEFYLSPDQLKIYSSARKLWFADQCEEVSLENDIYQIKDNPFKINNQK